MTRFPLSHSRDEGAKWLRHAVWLSPFPLELMWAAFEADIAVLDCVRLTCLGLCNVECLNMVLGVFSGNCRQTIKMHHVFVCRDRAQGLRVHTQCWQQSWATPAELFGLRLMTVLHAVSDRDGLVTSHPRSPNQNCSPPLEA